MKMPEFNAQITTIIIVVVVVIVIIILSILNSYGYINLFKSSSKTPTTTPTSITPTPTVAPAAPSTVVIANSSAWVGNQKPENVFNDIGWQSIVTSTNAYSGGVRFLLTIRYPMNQLTGFSFQTPGDTTHDAKYVELYGGLATTTTITNNTSVRNQILPINPVSGTSIVQKFYCTVTDANGANAVRSPVTFPDKTVTIQWTSASGSAVIIKNLVLF